MFELRTLVDIQPEVKPWLPEVLEGLQDSPKRLPSKLFYDHRGSQLFDQICTLPEYYPTRAEQTIMETHIEDMAAHLGPDCLLIEYGSGSSMKTRKLLDHLPKLVGYVPIDISESHLLKSAANIARAYPGLDVLPVCADYEAEFNIPQPDRPVRRRVAYFPGSTIGNFHPAEAVDFLRQLRATCGYEADLLIGIDLKKDTGLLHRAYNDCAGVTADFNRNILRHLNRELGTDFDLGQFEHCAFYNEAAGRIEMHLVSKRRQSVCVNGRLISFEADERIWTESSYKYTLEEFAALAAQAGFSISQVWTDQNNLFSVQLLTPAGE